MVAWRRWVRLDEGESGAARLRWWKAHTGTLGALAFLVVVAVSKTLLTKLLFEEVGLPIACTPRAVEPAFPELSRPVTAPTRTAHPQPPR